MSRVRLKRRFAVEVASVVFMMNKMFRPGIFYRVSREAGAAGRIKLVLGAGMGVTRMDLVQEEIAGSSGAAAGAAITVRGGTSRDSRRVYTGIGHHPGNVVVHRRVR